MDFYIQEMLLEMFYKILQHRQKSFRKVNLWDKWIDKWIQDIPNMATSSIGCKYYNRCNWWF